MSNFTILKREFIFPKGKHFKECHASTVLPLDDGRVLAAWFAGTKEKNTDVSIWMGVRKDDKWRVFEMVKIGPVAHWYPVLFENFDGTINLYFKAGENPKNWVTYVMTSSDMGETWTLPIELVVGDKTGGRGPVRCNPIYSHNNNIMAPSSVETDAAWDAFVDISKDNGLSWEKAMVPLDHSNISDKGIIQPTLWLGENNDVHMLLRSTEGYIFRSDSSDDGQTWAPAYKIDISNNNSGIDLAKLDDGRLVMIYNPVSDNWGKRTPISLSISDDNGYTWHSKFDLETMDGEFSYPAMIFKDNTLYITHTWCRETIEYWEIEIN
jgi:predicted neuraminidase